MTNLADLLVKRLSESKENLKLQFFTEHSIQVARHFVLDNFLPTEIAEEVYNQFPKPQEMRSLNSYGELKLKYSYIKNTSPLLQELHFAIQNPRFISVIEEITEIRKQVPDTSRLAGGVSALLRGHYINPHLDTSHDVDKKVYRTVNVLYYLTPDWRLENGGNYELWDKSINHRIVVPSLFNRLVVMATNRTSWHSVSPVISEAPRRCMFNYFFSEQSPEEVEYFHAASSFSIFNPLFRPRPEQKIRRAIALIRDRILNKDK